MWPEPLAKILAASGGVVIIAIIGVLGMSLKSVADAANSRAKAADITAKTAAAIAEAARGHVADVERRMELQRLTFRKQARELGQQASELDKAELRLRAAEWQRETNHTQWREWAASVQAAQTLHYEWDQEVVKEIERLGGHVREAPEFEVHPPVEFL
jgi:hypothetical protein